MKKGHLGFVVAAALLTACGTSGENGQTASPTPHSQKSAAKTDATDTARGPSSGRLACTAEEWEESNSDGMDFRILSAEIEYSPRRFAVTVQRENIENGEQDQVVLSSRGAQVDLLQISGGVRLEADIENISLDGFNELDLRSTDGDTYGDGGGLSMAPYAFGEDDRYYYTLPAKLTCERHDALNLSQDDKLLLRVAQDLEKIERLKAQEPGERARQDIDGIDDRSLTCVASDASTDQVIVGTCIAFGELARSNGSAKFEIEVTAGSGADDVEYSVTILERE